MKVLAYTKYSRLGASSRLRTFQYLPLLEREGINVSVQSLFDEDYLNLLYKHQKHSKINVIKCYFKRLISLFFVRRYDLIWVEKELFPYFPAVFERMLNRFGVKYIVDYDDAIFHNYDHSKRKVIRVLLSRKIDNVMKSSTCVIAGNDYIASRAFSAGARNIEKIPTVVDHRRYDSFTEDIDKELTVGWIGSPSTQKYLFEIAPALLSVYNNKRFKLLLVGANSEVKQHMDGLEVEVVSWSEESEVSLIQRMDVGLMPLKDGPWEKGKCGYKLIQYMASGVSIIASPVGVNESIVNNSNAGFLATNNEEWAAALMELLDNEDTNRLCGVAGKKAVESIYSLESQIIKLAKIIKASASSID